MDYLSVKEIAELWGVSIRMVNYYLNTGRIQGAIRKSGGWLIPANTPHPADLRKSGQRDEAHVAPRCFDPGRGRGGGGRMDKKQRESGGLQAFHDLTSSAACRRFPATNAREAIIKA